MRPDPMIESRSFHSCPTLNALVRHADRLRAVRKSDLNFGDRVFVTTANSVYSIHVLEDGYYSISGGWFDRKGLSPMKTTITGCTWGGSAILMDVVAACGLHLEFGNQVLTSGIRNIHVIPFHGRHIH
jgi:hypothetical protein